MNMQAYRTLFVGTLVQESALSVGGTDDPYATVDSPLCRDGQGRFTLRGSSLAGALVATLRRLADNVPAEISGMSGGGKPSVWRCFASHPIGTVVPVLRQHVVIHPETGASANGALYNVETLPPGSKWPFLLEVDTVRGGLQAERLARQVLAQWQQGRCRLGREVARGLGWMRLEGLAIYRLGIDDVDAWPDAGMSHDYPRYLAEHLAARRVMDEDECDAPPAPRTLEFSGRCHAGPQADGWGFDSLSLGGHSQDEFLARWNESYLAPDGQAHKYLPSAFDPDFAVASMNPPGTASGAQPFIPGSSLRGVLRHALARLLRAAGADNGLEQRLFGTLESDDGPCDGKLLVRDAYPRGPCRLAWFQHHAEDEFAGGAYGASKFDRVAVVEGCFEWMMVIEAGSDAELRELYTQAMQPLLALAQAGQLGLGGGQWRGHGWLRWDVDPITLPWSQE